MHGYGVYTKGCGNVMANTNLSNAKRNKKDEFYTQWSDIEKEMNAYGRLQELTEHCELLKNLSW